MKIIANFCGFECGKIGNVEFWYLIRVGAVCCSMMFEFII